MFEVGDVVVCVDGSACKCRKRSIRHFTSVLLGRVYRVEAVMPGAGFDGVALVLAGVPASIGHRRGVNAARFRKVKPASAKFTAQMRALKPAPQHANHPTEGAI